LIYFSFYLFVSIGGRERELLFFAAFSPFYSKGGNSGRPNEHPFSITPAKEKKRLTSENSEKVKLGKNEK